MSDCIPWTRYVNAQGYGATAGTGAYRLAYIAAKGPIPVGMEIDHTCHSFDPTCPGGRTCLHRRCVNPDHLEAVTPRENAIRSQSTAGKNARKTACLAGHPLDDGNTYVRRNGERQCKECGRRRWRECYRRRQAAADRQEGVSRTNRRHN